MGHESIGDFAYINTFPEYGTTNNNYEMQQQPYPDSFQQMQQVQHLNRAFSPQSSVPHQQQQQQQYQHQQQPLYNQQQPQHQYQQQRQYSEPSVQLYPEPELVDTRENETNAAAARTTAAGRSLSYISSASSASPLSKPTRRIGRKGIFWIGGAVVITLIGAVITLIVLMKSGDSKKDSANSSGNTNNEDSRPHSTYSAQLPPQPTSLPEGGGGGSEGPEVQPPQLPTFPAKDKPCPSFLCVDYNSAYQNVCTQDGA
ncbi:hypothetical protein BGZ96_003652, partial [Linnemannia gamsii]